MTRPASLSNKYRADVAAYQEVQGDYQTLARIIEAILRRATRELGIEAIVQVRAKELASFAEKTIRKQKEYPDPVNMMNDLCGARVITESTNDIEPICAFIRKHFEVDEATTEDTGTRLGIGEFGYRSVHFTVALKAGVLDEEVMAVLRTRPETEAEAIKKRLLERRSAGTDGPRTLGPGPRYRAEIQVRSLLQHAWANLYHDRVYKSAFQLPTDLQRRLRRIAAILEDADDQFAQAIQKVDGYRDYFGAYLTPEQLLEELEKLGEVRVFDPDNLKLVLRNARLALSLERWADVTTTLEPFVNQWETSLMCLQEQKVPKGQVLEQALDEVQKVPRGQVLDKALDKFEVAETEAERRHARLDLEDCRDPKIASLLLDYGTAKWRSGNDSRRARQCLKRATGLDLGSADALITLGDTYDEENHYREALRYYRRAFEVNPLEPRAVRGYLQLTAEENRNLDFVAPMRPTLRNVIQRCQERAALGIYLPWAWFDIGFFLLLLGEDYEGIGAYAKAIELSHADSPINASRKQARRLCENLYRTGATQWPLLERFLMVAWVAKHYRRVADALTRIATREEELGKARKPVSDPEWAELAASKDEAEAGRAEANRICAQIAPGIASKECPPLRQDGRSEKVVIVAGGCAPAEKERLASYKPMLREGFRDFVGTIFSGGTHSGIAGMVGDLPASTRGPILKVACLPQSWPMDHKVHEGYAIYNHPGHGFAPIGAVQVWADILSQGILPADVRVLGIGGGRYAGLEYRLALMMGARVGVMKGSGGAADAILDDSDWRDHPHLMALPYDVQTLRLFVSGFASGILTPEQREEAGRLNHARNVEKRLKEEVTKQVLPENQPWESLRSDLKASILERVDFIAEQLDAKGMRAVSKERLPPGVTPIKKFTPKQIEVMAEMEHGRWCVNKLLSGWRLGEKKDDKAKTHPDLIPWDLLDDLTKEKDRVYVESIPDLLDEQGYIILPAEAAG